MCAAVFLLFVSLFTISVAAQVFFDLLGMKKRTALLGVEYSNEYVRREGGKGLGFSYV